MPTGNQVNQLSGLAFAAFSASAGMCLAQDGEPGESVRSFVEARCGAQLAAFEAGRELGTSIFRLDGARWDGREPPTDADLALGTWSSLAFSGIHDLVKVQNAGLSEGRSALARRLAATLALADCLAPSEADRRAMMAAGKATGGIHNPGSLPSIACQYDRLRQAQAALAGDMDDAALDARLHRLRDDDTCVEGG
jgi:hypothetical protein